MTVYLSDLTRRLTPYVPGEQPSDRNYIKLNTNENPYGPSEAVRQAIRDEVDALRLYPDPDCGALRACIAGRYGVESRNVFVGNGSDEVLAFAFPAFFTGGTVLFPNITYSFYPVYADLFQAGYVEVPLREDLSIDAADYCGASERTGMPDGTDDAIDPRRITGILIPNPNAPTGRLLEVSEIERIVRSNPDRVVLIDEAYVDFGGESAVPLTARYDNLLVVMTLSKSRSLAGLRVGFAIGSEKLIAGLETIKNSFNSYTVDRLAQAGAMAAIRDEQAFEGSRGRIIATRGRVTQELEKMGFDVVPSAANFVFIRHPEARASSIFSALRERGILVRYFNKPLIDDRLRVTIGTDAEMDAFLDALGRIVK